MLDIVEPDVDEPDIRRLDQAFATNQHVANYPDDALLRAPRREGDEREEITSSGKEQRSKTHRNVTLLEAVDTRDEPVTTTITRRATFGGTPSIPTPPTRFSPPPPPQSIGAALLTPERKLAPDPTWTTSFRNSVKSSFFVWLLPFVPVCWALHHTHQSEVVVCVLSFVAILPLASLLSFATEQLALRVGDALGGLLNATFGNAVELLISVLALVKGQVGLVQASMVGSILSNTLLVLGMCYFAGGLRFHEQMYTVSSSQVQISLLGLSISAIVLPAGYHFASSSLKMGGTAMEEKHILAISRGLSFMLLSVYVMYLVFILYTHSYLFKLPRPGRPHNQPNQPHPHHTRVFPKPRWIPSLRGGGPTSPKSGGDDGGLSGVMTMESRNSGTEEGVDLNAPIGGSITMEDEEDEEVEEIPKLKPIFAVSLLLVVTGLTGYTAEVLLSSLSSLTTTAGITPEFIGLILLPLIGNSVEHVAAVTVSVKDKLDLGMAIAVGSSIQVSLCLLPVLVLVGRAIGQPMSLVFDGFETISLAVSLLLVNFAISDGRTQYMEGYILMISYAMIALVCWFYDPDSGAVMSST